MKYGAVLFDLDGTLLDTLEDLADSTNETLAKYGFKQHPAIAYKKFVGNGLKNLLKVASPADTDEETIDKMLIDLKIIYNRNYINKTCEYKNIHVLLETLKKAGIKMGICSNKADIFTKEIVEKIIGNGYFDVVFGEREGIPRKPDPASLLEAAGYLEVKPENTVYVGDSGSDMVCAKRAGMLAVGALWGFRGRDELVENGAEVLISDPMQLLEHII